MDRVPEWCLTLGEVSFEVCYLLIRSLSCFIVADSHCEAPVDCIHFGVVREALEVVESQPLVDTSRVTLPPPVLCGHSKELSCVQDTAFLALEVPRVDPEDGFELAKVGGSLLDVSGLRGV
jgi:hypothetical protein